MPPIGKIASSPSDLRDYLDATNDASKRARFATMALVVGSVLVLAGLLNSLDSNWMLQRVRAVNKGEIKYVEEKLDLPHSDPRLDTFRNAYFNVLIRSYTDNYSIKVPFFGVTFDTNDLGLIGGLGLLITLGFLWFSLVRERDNLMCSFEVAGHQGDKELKKMYDLLAMRQVLTSPPPQTWGRKFILKLLHVLPVGVQSAVVVHDISTYNVGRLISETHTITVLVAEVSVLLLMLIVTYWCIVAGLNIDRVWSEQWEVVREVQKKDKKA